MFETRPLSVWFFHALTAEGLPAICIDARHSKAVLEMAANKTDANDAGDWPRMRLQASELGRQLVVDARSNEACQLLMSVPGVGVVTATSFATAIEGPGNFRKSRSVGAWLGLTTRRYQSGEVDYEGYISTRGDSHVRSLLFEAATVILTRSTADSTLRTLGARAERAGRL